MPLVAAPQLEMMVLIWAKLRALLSFIQRGLGSNELSVLFFAIVIITEECFLLKDV